ncbi:hypothetical protein [Bremerella cremea]|uniref:hypothetical protein n=1 Tax=Bremerella cremea TaxID=1031537 RepID=UPI0030B7F68B
MPNHWHLVLRPTADWGMSDFLRWVTLKYTILLPRGRPKKASRQDIKSPDTVSFQFFKSFADCVV